MEGTCGKTLEAGSALQLLLAPHALRVAGHGCAWGLGAGGAAPPAWRSSGPALNRRWVFQSLPFVPPEKLI